MNRDQGPMQPARCTEDAVEHQSGRLATVTFGDLPRDALLTAAEVAEWLKIGRRQGELLRTRGSISARRRLRTKSRAASRWLETRRGSISKSCISLSPQASPRVTRRTW